MVQKAAAGSVETQPVAAAPPPQEVGEVNEERSGIGITGFDKKPSARKAKCFVCGDTIEKGPWRWTLMPPAPRGRMYHLHKYLHPACPSSARFPQALRAPSVAYLAKLSADEVPIQLGLPSALEALRAGLPEGPEGPSIDS